MTHMHRIDHRIEIVTKLIIPFENQLDNIKEICENDRYDYWDSIYADDTEHIVGTVFIILQNYINSSISDLFPELSKLYLKFTNDKTIGDSGIPRVRLINEIANYYKHRDLPTNLYVNSTDIFNRLGIEYIHFTSFDENKKIIYIHKVGADSPVFKGFSLLSENWSFKDLIDIVSEWREDMWIQEEK